MALKGRRQPDQGRGQGLQPRNRTQPECGGARPSGA